MTSPTNGAPLDQTIPGGRYAHADGSLHDAHGKDIPMSDGSGGTLPRVADMEEVLSVLNTAEEVKALQARDTRKGAQPLYAARLAELEGSKPTE